jgi:hypothetical protein
VRRALLLSLLLCWSCKSEPLDAAPPSAPRSIQVFDQVRISSDDQAEHVRKAGAELDFGAEPVSSARLIVELTSPCFPFEDWNDQEIPAGHNWPLLCDAFDRALTVSLDDPEQPGQGAPGLELLRAVTPFGGPATFESDVTDVVNGLPGVHRLQVDIGTWGDPEGIVSGAKGEWRVSVRVELEPGPAPRRVLAVQSLVFSSQTEPAPAALALSVPEGASLGRIEYRATGHGAANDPRCRGPAEEFCDRVHTLALDAEVVDEFIAWRDDCAELCTLAHFEDETRNFDYCAENPCGAESSVRAPRANWCPGSLTPAHVVESAALASPGAHELETRVSELTEGGNWLISLTYFAFE